MSDFKSLEIPGHVSLVAGAGGLRKVVVNTESSEAEIYLHGAHVTHFCKKGEPPLLFMSAASEFAAGKPIRGGVPLIFPWFGPREGFPAHGFARTVEWELAETSLRPDGAVSLLLRLPDVESYELSFRVTVADRLSMELGIRNTAGQDTVFETCLHTYFQVSEIHAVSIHGLAGVRYLDKVAAGETTEGSAPIQIAGEVDRVYLDTAATVEIADSGFGRRIRVEKSGSASTVVWNPWIEKSIRMPDFGEHEYLQMVCVESGNVAQNQITLAAGESAVLTVVVSSEALLS